MKAVPAARDLAEQAFRQFEKYESTGRPRHLERAVVLFRQAADGAESHDRGARLSDLGAALQALHEKTGKAPVLDEVVAIGRLAVEATAPGHPDRACHLANLSLALLGRYDRDCAAATLDDAIGFAREAAALDHPERARYLAILG
jgi:hypothetical protein